MKYIKHTIWLAVAASLVSCKKKTDDPVQNTQTATEATVTFNISNEVDGTAVELGKMKYTNTAGNLYQIDLLKYYVTNIVLENDKGDTVVLKNYDLIDAYDPASCNITAPKIPNGTYTKMRFYIGVDQARNHNGAQDGDLSPAKGMIWEWNTGYIFFKHEGKYKNTSNQEKALLLHYGTDPALASVSMPVNFTVKGSDKKVFLKFNLNSVYASPNTIDFNTDNNRQSDKAGDAQWISNTKANFTDAFTFDKAE